MSDWTPNDAGQREWLVGSADLSGVLGKVASQMESYAQSIAPVGDPASDPHPGMYRDSFRHDVTVSKVFKGPDRLVGHVHNDAPHAAAVEYGYSGRHDSPGRNAHHTLTRAIDAARGVI